MLSITGWMLVATGFTGALSARFVFDLLAKKAGFGSKTSIHLAPAGGASSVLAGLIAKARKEVLMIIPAPRARQVVESLINACKKGVHVELLIDPAAPKVCPGECEMLRQAGATLLFDPEHSPIVGTQLLIDHKTVALGAIRSGAPGEPDGLDNLTVLKGQPEEVNQFRDFFTTHKGHAQNLFAPAALAAAQAPAAPKPAAPVPQPQASVQTHPQTIQQPISQAQTPPVTQATINPNDPASLLQAAREAAARGDQNRAAAYLEAAKNADRRMQEAAAAASGVRMSA
jgi:hypothetical protein